MTAIDVTRSLALCPLTLAQTVPTYGSSNRVKLGVFEPVFSPFRPAAFAATSPKPLGSRLERGWRVAVFTDQFDGAVLRPILAFLKPPKLSSFPVCPCFFRPKNEGESRDFVG